MVKLGFPYKLFLKGLICSWLVRHNDLDDFNACVGWRLEVGGWVRWRKGAGGGSAANSSRKDKMEMD